MQEKERYQRQVEINSTHINPHVLEFNIALKNNRNLSGIVREVIEQRPNLTPLHFGLLIQAACQYIWLENQEKWKIKRGKENWEELLPQIIEEHYEEIISLCRCKNIAITVPERYCVLKATINLLFGQKPVIVFDMGSGFIPRGLGAIVKNKTEFLPKASEFDSGELIKPLLKEPIQIERAICTDIQPCDPSWTAACYWCSFSELRALRDIFKQESDIPLPANLEFRLFDITDPDIEPIADLKGKVDIVMMSNILYQLNQEERERAIKNVVKLLKKPEGRLLSLEYLPKGSRRKPFTFGAQIYSKTEEGDLSNAQELFRLDSADCKEIKVGKDFHKISQPMMAEG